MEPGFFISLHAIRRQLAAMPSELYLVRLIHHHTRKPFPAEPLWTGFQLSCGAMLRFLRLRNREGFDVYLRPYAEHRNAGYILLDLDHLAGPSLLRTLHANGHEPCVLLRTSPGHLQAWVRVSPTPLEPAVATAVGKHLAHTYGGDLASTDWCHLGRLAGFTNQKPARRQPSGHPPWVKLLQAQPRLATHGLSLVQAAERKLSPAGPPTEPIGAPRRPAAGRSQSASASRQPGMTTAAATDIYARWLNRLRIPQRFPQPDWSIADLWIAKELLRCRAPAEQIQAILRLGSPGFPRRHSDPEDYLGRTLRRAAREIEPAFFSAGQATPGPLEPPPASSAHGDR